MTDKIPKRFFELARMKSTDRTLKVQDTSQTAATALRLRLFIARTTESAFESSCPSSLATDSGRIMQSH